MRSLPRIPFFSGLSHPGQSPPVTMTAMLRALVLCVTVAALVLPLTAAPADWQALRMLEKAYVDGWVANDQEKVMATIHPDAVIIPSGMSAIRGAEKIAEFWFPSDGSTTTVTSYRTTISDVHVHGDTGWLYGNGELSFTWRKGDERMERSQKSTFTMIARRETNGQWRIVHRMWSDTRRP